MNNTIHILFKHLNRNGTILVEYLQNPDPITSGFDALKDTCNFDINLCKLYPTLNAKVDSYEGDGYRKLMGWIQFVTRHDIQSGTTKTSIIVDVVGELGMHSPFFAVGYPPEMYDAPMWNLGKSDKLIWVAEAFLTTVPSRMSGDSISFLAGFQWGYEEFDVDGVRNVNILPFKQVDGSAWNEYLPLLNEKFPRFKYAKSL